MRATTMIAAFSITAGFASYGVGLTFGFWWQIASLIALWIFAGMFGAVLAKADNWDRSIS